ncbi:UDP-2,4-diacetamido-2,4,6-trideoxy-beta-L-altropyranose hydrolase [Plesiomonas shigelloides]|uniref:UDP-2,4-diacetamido-2,4, 6-trideoxy-beta-L-altropyranose hydrolase n=1 Tax=Plesiomonas shigelloides TaxID=703 RepID=UPI0015AA2D75|nr:UDP-2,4-diacetamido-2,4,6-trideoxy-beta-L-altropyranose hydrolase [Plesiomonas shigelloides]
MRTEKPRHILIRADASALIGTGHVMRCMVLAQHLTELGCQVHFICRDLPGNLNDYIAAHGYGITVLPDNAESVTWQDDVANIITQHAHADGVIVDHYQLGKEWESTISTHFACPLLAIDDMNRPHQSDVILDQNLWPAGSQRYLNSPGTHLIGPEYALLRPSFASLREQHLPRENQLLVCFGGSDPTGECEKFLRAVQEMPALPFTVLLIAGRANLRYPQLQAIEENTDVLLYAHRDDFEQLLATSHYMIGASGSSNWERLCLNTPASVVCVADNQREISRHLAKENAVRYLGEAEHLTPKDYAHELSWINSHWQQLNRFNPIMIDGKGASRVARKFYQRVNKKYHCTDGHGYRVTADN